MTTTTKEMDENAAVILPDCLIIDIFSRLPVKSLCRFKCVSKFCHSFIQDTSFIDSIRPKTPILLQMQHRNDLYVYSLNCNGFSTLKHTYDLGNDFQRGGYVIDRYCNGLNCYLHDDNDGNFGLTLCNLTTKELISWLPMWCNDCIFCFDSSSNKYKVLGWVNKDDDTHLDFQILTLERDPSWRPVMNPLKMDYILEPDVIINGEPFWLDIYGGETRIISFNPANEEFRVISLPDEVCLETFWYYIFEFEGSLTLVEQHRQCEVPTFSLWILNDNVWVIMKKNIAMPFEITDVGGYSSRPIIECLPLDGFNFSSRGGEILMAVLPYYDYNFLFIYSFLNNQFKRIPVTELPLCDFRRAIRCKEGGFKMRNCIENYLSLQELV